MHTLTNHLKLMGGLDIPNGQMKDAVSFFNAFNGIYRSR